MCAIALARIALRAAPRIGRQVPGRYGGVGGENLDSRRTGGLKLSTYQHQEHIYVRM